MINVNQVYNIIGGGFSMRHKIKVLSIGESHAFVRIIYPECWGLTNCETVLKLETITKEYK